MRRRRSCDDACHADPDSPRPTRLRRAGLGSRRAGGAAVGTRGLVLRQRRLRPGAARCADTARARPGDAGAGARRRRCPPTTAAPCGRLRGPVRLPGAPPGAAGCAARPSDRVAQPRTGARRDRIGDRRAGGGGRLERAAARLPSRTRSAGGLGPRPGGRAQRRRPGRRVARGSRRRSARCLARGGATVTAFSVRADRADPAGDHRHGQVGGA